MENMVPLAWAHIAAQMRMETAYAEYQVAYARYNEAKDVLQRANLALGEALAVDGNHTDLKATARAIVQQTVAIPE